LAPTPTNISSKSELQLQGAVKNSQTYLMHHKTDPEAKKNGTPASPATARANNVLPVPGDPVSRTPLGSLPPRVVKVDGSLRKSTTSCSSYYVVIEERISMTVKGSAVYGDVRSWLRRRHERR
jgi:hypothetical protein